MVSRVVGSPDTLTVLALVQLVETLMIESPIATVCDELPTPCLVSVRAATSPYHIDVRLLKSLMPLAHVVAEVWWLIVGYDLACYSFSVYQVVHECRCGNW